jgi:effector-binding domain-containing protein
MKILKIILLVILALVSVLILMYAYYGGFNKVKFQISEQGGETVVYKEMIGDYNKSGFLMDTIHKMLLTDDKLDLQTGFGIYYDNPQEIEKNKLRADVGYFINDVDSAKLAELQAKYMIKTLPRGKYLYTEIPFKGKLSIFIGIMKVYPAMANYFKEQNVDECGAITEIYDTQHKKIIYRKAL